MLGNGCIIGVNNIPTTKRASGVWSMQDHFYQLDGELLGLNWPPVADPSFSSVTSLCHFNGPFTKGGFVEFAVPAGGGGQFGGPSFAGLTNDNAKFGLYSGATTSTSAVFLPSNVPTAFGTADLTIEIWGYSISTLGNQVLIGFQTSGTQVTPTIYFSGGLAVLQVSGAAKITAGAAWSTLNWHHVALSRNSGSSYLYIDGVQVGSTYVDTNNYVTPGFHIGAYFNSTLQFNGYYDEMRVTNGVGRYPSGTTFSPPVHPFEDY